MLFFWGSHPFMFSLCDLLGLVSSCNLATCGRLVSFVLGCDLHEHHALSYFSKWYLAFVTWQVSVWCTWHVIHVVSLSVRPV